jgi:hypothetical protein
VQGEGELGFMGEIASGIRATGPAGELGFPECLPFLPPEAFTHMGEAYLTRLQARHPTAARITDKLPQNFMFVGLIRLILPKAKIIHLRRDPIDTCFSCFSLHFDQDLDYVNDLAELGRYYRMYLDLMAHWRRLLPPEAMLEVDYEDLVADLEGETRRILDHCALPWDPRCLDFHKTERPVMTASVNQVRRPIYRSSVQRWRRYGPHLAPLIEALGPDPAGPPGAASP